MKRYVIHSAQLGVFLAPIDIPDDFTTAWAHPDDENEVAATFPSVEAVEKEIASWPGPPPVDWRAVEVEADGAGRATLAACLAAGLPAEGEEHRGQPLYERSQSFKPGTATERGRLVAELAHVKWLLTQTESFFERSGLDSRIAQLQAELDRLGPGWEKHATVIKGEKG